jgi:endonuclease-8
MRAGLEGRRPEHQVYRRAKLPCPRCGAPLRARGQGDANRTTYWCGRCQR